MMERKRSNEHDMNFLSTLTDNQAHLVLIHLLRDKPALIPKAVEIAREQTSGIDEDEIADEVCSALSVLDVRQLWDESGGTRDGYVDPNEHSYEMMEEIIEPYIEEMERYIDREMPEEALGYCRGIIKGVCTYMQEEAGEFADWATDSDDGLTADVITRWSKKTPDPDVIAELESFRTECLTG